MTTTPASANQYWTETADSVKQPGLQLFQPTTDIIIQIQPPQPSTLQQIETEHTPGFQLTKEERSKKHDLHKYGLCCSCDNGLDDRADFMCDIGGLMCNACCEYYTGGDGY